LPQEDLDTFLLLRYDKIKIADILKRALGNADCETANQLFFMVGLIGGFL